MTELLALVYVADVNLDDGRLQRTDAVVQGYRGVCVGSCIEHDAVVRESDLLHFVDKFTLDIALVIFDVDVGLVQLQLRQILFKR